MKQYTEEQLKDPNVRIEIYEQALKDWRTPFIWTKRTDLGATDCGFCYYFMKTLKNNSKGFLGYELKGLKTRDSLFWYFKGRGTTRKGRRARRKALRQAIQICKQKIKSNG